MAEPGRLVRAAAFGAMALALGTGLWHLPEAFRSADREADELAAASALERELRGARGVDVDTRVFAEARRLIPEKARYAVVTGPNVQVSNDVTLDAVAPFAGYWLLPRRQAPDLSGADWVLSYGGDLGALGLEYARVIEVSPGVALAEVRR